MLNYMFMRRKREILLLSIVEMCIIAIFGIITIITNASGIADICIVFGIGVVIVAEVVMGITLLPHEFNYAVGMGRTRKEFYKCNVIITLLYLVICYLIMIAAALGFMVIGFKGEALGIIINPIYSVIIMIVTIFSQFLYLWLFIEHQKVAYIVWIVSCIIVSNLVENSMEIADALIEGTMLDGYGEMIVFALGGIVYTLGFVFVSRKILRMQVRE